MTPAQAVTFAGLADRLIPRDGGMPSGSMAGVAGRRLPPHLEAPLTALLAEIGDEDPATILPKLERERPQAFALLFLAAAGSYLQAPQVRELLSYHGQEAETLPRGGFGGEEFIAAVIERGPRWRHDGILEG